MYACVYMKLPSILLFRLFTFRSLLRSFYSRLPELFIVLPHNYLFLKSAPFIDVIFNVTNFEPYSFLTYTHIGNLLYELRSRVVCYQKIKLLN